MSIYLYKYFYKKMDVNTIYEDIYFPFTTMN